MILKRDVTLWCLCCPHSTIKKKKIFDKVKLLSYSKEVRNSVYVQIDTSIIEAAHTEGRWRKIRGKDLLEINKHDR